MTQTEFGSGAPTGNPYIDALVHGDKWVQEPGEPAYISYWFQSKEADPRGIVPPFTEPWTENEKAAMRGAQASWEAVANVKFVEAENEGAADAWYWKDWSYPFLRFAGTHELPGNEPKPVYGRIASPVDGSEMQLPRGSFMYGTLIHELGHGLGLSHPFGGTVEAGTSFPGSENGAPGTYGLNSEYFTLMSNHSVAPNTMYGSAMTPMALDIAAIQAIYGANMKTATGDDTYVMPGANELGTGWACIWDAGGNDTLSAGNTDRNTTIQLREAPLVGEFAGGWLSSVEGIFGGFTIANGVTIENATGGGGSDDVFGNDAANVLKGLDGDDYLDGAGGKDTLEGGAGDDLLWGGGAVDLLNGGDGADEMYGEAGNDVLNGGGADDILDGDEGDDSLLGAGGNDRLFGLDGNDILSGGMGSDDMEGGAGGDTLLGAFGNDTLKGGGGEDSLGGSLGIDTLTGGAGRDRFIFSDAAGKANADTIADFNAAEDKIVINNQFFAKLVDGALDAKNFYIGAEAQGAKDYVVFDQATGNLWYDADGRLPAIAQQLICTLDVTGLTGTLTAGNFEII